jgi:mannose-1-phosphate guanylyltransferase
MTSAETPKQLVAVILAGGSGTRFWPASTAARPKQFLTLVGDRSLLQMSHDRVRALVPPERILVLTAERFVDEVRAHLPDLPRENIIGEPLRRDTAAAVALAGLVVEKRFGPSVMAVLTADHLIAPAERFQSSLLLAVQHCTADHVVTFGIEPTSPATGYGYLEVAEPTIDGVARVERFHEKPDRKTAEEYVESGRFLWNSGMFVWHTAGLRESLARFLPEHLDALAAVVEKGELSHDALKAAFAPLPSVSIDKGVMEKLGGTMCVRARFDWSDVGSFPALAPHLDNDGAHNAHRGALAIRDARDNIVWCEDAHELVALVGVSDLIVVRAGKRTLVAPRSRAEEIKKLVESLPPDDQ